MEFDPERVRAFLTKDEFNLYKMIFERFVGSQMKPALFDVTDIDILNGPVTLRASGEIIKFPGFLSVFKDDEELEETEADAVQSGGKILPPVSEGDRLELLALDTRQNFTQPPSRYTEATLVKALEENGIGRPSTYGSILQTIQTRDYTYKDEEKRFRPSELGMLVTRLLRESFADIIDEKYTARMEEELDEIEEGRLEWKKSISGFAKKFNRDLEKAKKQMTQVKGEGVKTDEVCENCGSPMVIKFGRFGEFLACSNYPECKTTKEIVKEGSAAATDEQIVCDKCGKPMVLKRSRFGQFWACTGYPECRNTKDPKLLKVNLSDEPQPPCEKCGKEMVLKSGRYGPFFSCSGYPECSNIRKISRGGKVGAAPEATGVKCPECGEGELVQRFSRRGAFYSCNRYPKCKFAVSNKPIAKKCPDCGNPILVEKESKRMGRIEACPIKECGYKAPLPEAPGEKTESH